MVKKLTFNSCEFKIGAQFVEQIPDYAEKPEFAFAGRSNAGKSTLINAITKRKALARTSRNPGCTKQLNFFLIDDAIYMVDMPGYGFAKVSKSEISGWNKTITDYLAGRPNLKRVFLLSDGKVGLKDTDIEVMKKMDVLGVSYQIVLTKADKKYEKEVLKTKEKILANSKKHTAMHPEILITSSEDNIGIEEMRNIIERFL